MIISASRRTDIPAFYSDWFFNRIKEGSVLVRNPVSSHQVSKISLSPDAVDCIVFWTKNPGPMLERLPELNPYHFYFQFTLNSYDTSIETNVPEKRQLIETFRKLSGMIGRERVIWRYDPVLLTRKFNAEYHAKWFGYLAEKLCNYTDRCVISFMDLYKKTERNLRGIGLLPMDNGIMNELAGRISAVSSKVGIRVESCSEAIDLERYGIRHGKCIDDALISKITGKRIKPVKDPNQRPNCGCVKSVDIGAYNTCGHHCLYCYANSGRESVKRNVRLHHDQSPLLVGELGEKDIVTVRPD